MAEEEELRVLKLEFNWLLQEHIPKVLKQLGQILRECSRFLELSNSSGSPTTSEDVKPPDYFMLSTPNSDTLKGYVAVEGDNISKADLKFKLPKVSSSGFRVFIREQSPWKLRQVQDAKNYLQLALEKVRETTTNCNFSSGKEVSKVVDEITGFLTKGKTRLMVPEKNSVLDLLTSGSQKIFKPGLPDEVLCHFHLTFDKIVLSVYTLNPLPVPPQNLRQFQENDPVGYTLLYFKLLMITNKLIHSEFSAKWMEVTSHFQVECAIPKLKDCVLLFGLALRLCQQLKDKVAMFSVLDGR